MPIIRSEAESMALTNYLIESSISSASGNALISLRRASSPSGTAAFSFAGTAGHYDIVLGYYDENDGQAQLEILKNGASLATLTLNQNLGSDRPEAKTLVRKTVAPGLFLSSGETIQIRGTADQGEWVRVDYVELVPAANAVISGTQARDTLRGNALDNIIYGLKGNDTLMGRVGSDILNGGAGIDTATYADASRGVVANLTQGFAFVSAYSSPLKIMPLGDSITYGVLGGSKDFDNASNGGYRNPLWQQMTAENIAINFVGSLANGPPTLTDQDHEGHPGWKIEHLTSAVDGFLSPTQPDVVLLMIGTNNTRTDTLSVMSSKLSALIDQIVIRSPSTQILVASLPPVHPDKQSATRVQRAEDFNQTLPQIINSKVAQGKKVHFVDMSRLGLSDLTSSTSLDLDNGLHPNPQGYGKIAAAWHDAILDSAGDKDTLISIENLMGSDFDDVLTGSSGSNLLRGGGGRDRLAGIGSPDIFSYRQPSEGNDVLVDFDVDDTLRISAAGFGGGLVAGTPLSLTAAATGVLVSSPTPTAMGTGAHFLYNTTTGLLDFDQDGAGAKTALNIATLLGTPALTAQQFHIVA